MKREITTLTQLREFAEWFLGNVPKGTAIGLSGDLGAGKTTFVRTLVDAIAAQMGVTPPRVVSPTYVIETRYPHLNPCIEHFDLYRLENVDPKALTDIGYYEALEHVQEKEGWVFVEWPEKATSQDHLRLAQVIWFSLSDKGRWVDLGL